jgi:hypothetical protein
MTTRGVVMAFVAVVLAASAPAWAQSGGMKMPMAMPEKPAHFAPTRQAYTTNHRFLIKLLSVPRPIPYEKYFDLRFAVYDAKHPDKQLPDAGLEIYAGMRHGMKTGFAHGMQSAPKIDAKGGVFTISGMYFHMMGPWTLKATVTKGKETGVAYFQLPCCAR